MEYHTYLAIYFFKFRADIGERGPRGGLKYPAALDQVSYVGMAAFVYLWPGSLLHQQWWMCDVTFIIYIFICVQIITAIIFVQS